MSTTETNERFDSLCNRDISTHYRDKKFHLLKNDFIAAFAYWVVSQSHYKAPSITDALIAFSYHVDVVFDGVQCKVFTYSEVAEVITDDIFESIPAIERLQHSTTENPTDFISLGALSRNVFYMILREQITQPV